MSLNNHKWTCIHHTHPPTPPIPPPGTFLSAFHAAFPHPRPPTKRPEEIALKPYLTNDVIAPDMSEVLALANRLRGIVEGLKARRAGLGGEDLREGPWGGREEIREKGWEMLEVMEVFLVPRCSGRWVDAEGDRRDSGTSACRSMESWEWDEWERTREMRERDRELTPGIRDPIRDVVLTVEDACENLLGGLRAWGRRMDFGEEEAGSSDGSEDTKSDTVERR